jgi:undecaprenyl phosphate-alpha-L-ara4FN deformylase
MLERTHIGLKVDVDTLRGTREGVPRLAALFKKLKVDATFYFSVGPDHTGRALRRVFRKGFAQKVARTSVLKHYGLKTLLYGVLLPGPDIGREAGAFMRGVHDGGFEVGLHTYDHVRWQDYVAGASEAWTRIEFERGMNAFKQVFGFFPPSHAAAGWQINAHALELEREYGLTYASDTRGRTPFWPRIKGGRSTCPQLPTTLPTFDELLGRDGIDESTIADAVFRLCEPSQHGGGNGPSGGNALSGKNSLSAESAPSGEPLHVFTLHAELEGMLLLDAFESLLRKWQAAGAHITRMAGIRELSLQQPLPDQTVVMGEVPGRSGLLAMQPANTEAA